MEEVGDKQGDEERNGGVEEGEEEGEKLSLFCDLEVGGEEEGEGEEAFAAAFFALNCSKKYCGVSWEEGGGEEGREGGVEEERTGR